MNNEIFMTLTCYNSENITSPWYIKNKNTGLGNMLFQTASGLSYAKENNATLFVPALNTYFEKEELNKENTIFRKMNTDIVKGFDETKNSFLTETDYIFSIPFINNIHFSGYLENYHNFDKNRSLILDYFRPTEEDKNYLYNKYPFIKDENISSIHIRMGPDIQCIIPTERKNEIMVTYYNLIDHMILHKNINSLIVVTNDIEYCKQILTCEKYKDIIFYYSDEIHSFNDVWLISLVKNNILSFSTLAWWGSYLNEHKNKYIIGSNNVTRKNLKCHEWIYI
jgi:hypothetical protein